MNDPAPAPSGYRKGEETRQRLLEAALEVFAATGFQAASTRQIAGQAGVTLPALQYYFGGKEGLYKACAVAEAERMAGLTADAAREAAAALSRPADKEKLRAVLKQTMGSVARAMITSAQSRIWGAFAARELLDPGPAFDIMMDRLWRPGIELVANMVAQIEGRGGADEAARIRAMLLISSLTAFQSGRAVAMRTLAWRDFGESELAAVIDVLHSEIDRL